MAPYGIKIRAVFNFNTLLWDMITPNKPIQVLTILHKVDMGEIYSQKSFYFITIGGPFFWSHPVGVNYDCLKCHLWNFPDTKCWCQWYRELDPVSFFKYDLGFSFSRLLNVCWPSQLKIAVKRWTDVVRAQLFFIPIPI